MSLSIENLKFTIFGSGHDATLLDSGDGDIMFFSHPFVPLNSVNYAGQYLFYVPDQNGDPIDAVKDDIAHCTFSPAIGATFDTEGENTVTVHYHREYILAEDTIIVDKVLSQTIEVVDHGAIARAGGWYAAKSCYCNCDIYADGYCFMRPRLVNTVEATYLTVYDDASITKLSSFPWRINQLSGGTNGTFKCSGLEDISELQYGDTSNVTSIGKLFDHVTQVTDWTPISGWDTSKVTSIGLLMPYSTAPDLTAFADWDVSNVVNMSNLLANYLGTSIHGLENWDVSKVRDITYLLSGASYVTSLEPLFNWAITGITSLQSSFGNCKAIKNLHGLENFDVSLVTNLSTAFNNDIALEDISALLSWVPKPTTMYRFMYDCSKLLSYSGVDNFDTSDCTTFEGAFNNTWKCTDLEPFRGWDVSSGQNFSTMFAQGHWFTTLEPLSDWDFSSMTSAVSMFGQNSALTDVDVPWDIPVGANITNMFVSLPYYYATDLQKYVYKTATVYIDYEGNTYGLGINATLVTKDASDAEGWTSGSGRGAFDTHWSNRPSWN